MGGQFAALRRCLPRRVQYVRERGEACREGTQVRRITKTTMLTLIIIGRGGRVVKVTTFKTGDPGSIPGKDSVPLLYLFFLFYLLIYCFSASIAACLLQYLLTEAIWHFPSIKAIKQNLNLTFSPFFKARNIFFLFFKLITIIFFSKFFQPKKWNRKIVN